MDLRDYLGNSMLHYVAMQGEYDFLKKLVIKLNIDHINLVNDDGETIWHILAANGESGLNYSDLKKAIKKFNLDPLNIKDNNGVCLWHSLFSTASIEEIEEVINDYKLDPIHIIDNNGNNLWHYCAMSGRRSVEEIIKKFNLDPIKMVNNKGETMWHLLFKYTHHIDDVEEIIKNIDMFEIKDYEDRHLWKVLFETLMVDDLRKSLIDFNLNFNDLQLDITKEQFDSLDDDDFIDYYNDDYNDDENPEDESEEDSDSEDSDEN